jgi:hypothetical protein
MAAAVNTRAIAEILKKEVNGRTKRGTIIIKNCLKSGAHKSARKDFAP